MEIASVIIFLWLRPCDNEGDNSNNFETMTNNNNYYILKQWIALNAGADWLVKLRISCAIYLRATRAKMASRFASVTSEENIQINFFCCILSHCFSIY